MALVNNKRGKSSYTRDYALKDCYDYYKDKGGTLSYKKFRDIYEFYIANVMYHIIEKSADYRMPARLGDLAIRKKKIKMSLNEDGEVRYKNSKPDWNRTLKLWEDKYGTNDKEELKKIKDKPLLFYKNKHTSGYTFFIAWDKRVSNVKNQSKYLFIPARDFSRAIPKVQNKKQIDYYESINK